jgi:hypothetical protein
LSTPEYDGLGCDQRGGLGRDPSAPPSREHGHPSDRPPPGRGPQHRARRPALRLAAPLRAPARTVAGGRLRAGHLGAAASVPEHAHDGDRRAGRVAGRDDRVQGTSARAAAVVPSTRSVSAHALQPRRARTVRPVGARRPHPRGLRAGDQVLGDRRRVGLQPLHRCVDDPQSRGA